MEPRHGLHIETNKSQAFIQQSLLTNNLVIMMIVGDHNGDAVFLSMSIEAAREIEHNLDIALTVYDNPSIAYTIGDPTWTVDSPTATDHSTPTSTTGSTEKSGRLKSTLWSDQEPSLRSDQPSSGDSRGITDGNGERG